LSFHVFTPAAAVSLPAPGGAAEAEERRKQRGRGTRPSRSGREPLSASFREGNGGIEQPQRLKKR